MPITIIGGAASTKTVSTSVDEGGYISVVLVVRIADVVVVGGGTAVFAEVSGSNAEGNACGGGALTGGACPCSSGMV